MALRVLAAALCVLQVRAAPAAHAGCEDLSAIVVQRTVTSLLAKGFDKHDIKAVSSCDDVKANGLCEATHNGMTASQFCPAACGRTCHRRTRHHAISLMASTSAKGASSPPPAVMPPPLSPKPPPPSPKPPPPSPKPPPGSTGNLFKKLPGRWFKKLPALQPSPSPKPKAKEDEEDTEDEDKDEDEDAADETSAGDNKQDDATDAEKMMNMVSETNPVVMLSNAVPDPQDLLQSNVH